MKRTEVFASYLWQAITVVNSVKHYSCELQHIQYVSTVFTHDRFLVITDYATQSRMHGKVTGKVTCFTFVSFEPNLYKHPNLTTGFVDPA